MNDLINREDAIGALNGWLKQNHFPEIGDGILYLVPSADRPQGWIPCSERLPEDEGEYLVTAKKYAFDSCYYDVQIAYCSPNKKWFRISNCEIVAWMPRPKPWKGTNDDSYYKHD